MTDRTENLHASCVAIAGRGVLILGASGSGKSGLALQLLAYGATLVADDRTDITRAGDRLMADVPARIAGLIEARQVGLLRLPHAGPVPLALAVDMDRVETARLPESREYLLQGVALPCFHKCDSPHFPAAIHLYMTARMEPAI